MSETSLLDEINNHLLTYPLPHIQFLEINQQKVWIKQRPCSKKNYWHRLQRLFGWLIPIDILKPTVGLEGNQSLIKEAERYKKFTSHGIAVPQVLAVTQKFLVTLDSGMSLEVLIKKETLEKQQALIIQALASLISLHQKQLCHGRPALKDMTHHNGQIFFLDLEEDPLKVMSLATAQARDLWLFLLSVTRVMPDTKLISALYEQYLQHKLPSAVIIPKMVTQLKRIRLMLSWLPASAQGKDLVSAIFLNRTLENCL